MATVIEALRSYDAGRLARLLILRPGLMQAPSLDALATAITSARAVHEAVDDLPAPVLQVIEALAMLPDGCRLSELAGLDPEQDVPDRLEAVVTDLQDRFLLHPETGPLRLVGPVRQYLTSPLGLGRHVDSCHEYTPYVELCDLVQRLGLPRPRSGSAARQALRQIFSDTPPLAASLAGLPPSALALLRRADREGPVLRYPGVDPFQLLAPRDDDLQLLVQLGLLAIVGVARVELPLEVGLALRYPSVTSWRFDEPCDPVGGPTGDGQVEAACGAAVEKVLLLVDSVVARLEVRPAPLLASGAVGVKELRALAQELGEVSVVVTALTLLDRLGMLHATRKDLRVTKAWPRWRAQSEAARWTDLVRAWLALHDLPPARPGSSRRAAPALGYGMDLRGQRDRRRCLALLATSAEHVDWVARWDWRWPPARLRSSDPAGQLSDSELRQDVLEEAGLLGLVVNGVATPLARVLRGGQDGVEAVLESLATAGQDRVRAQADMTLVCTGMPSRSMRGALDRLARVEQSGAATVWRLSEQSLIGAFDEGDSPQQVLAVLAGYAGDLPQAMSYLVGDAHRRHGRVRVGEATSYVVVEDDAVLRDALLVRGSGGKLVKELGLRRVAAGVAVSRGSVTATVEVLRVLGVPAVAETPVVKATAVTRASPAPVRSLPELPELDPGEGAVTHAARLLR